ncbi:hypothetical protein [Deinococcus ficus]|uniref:hypothetical protein n=1 Tax=Deinococcus ficus TaxID=317577 RepID=UPI0017495018|nr:hypothetical protein [Deinococcus ficus]
MTVIPDYVLVISYKAVLRLAPDCPPGGVARIRKASTINRWGTYRPIKPNGSATYGRVWSWTMTEDSGPVAQLR